MYTLGTIVLQTSSAFLAALLVVACGDQHDPTDVEAGRATTALPDAGPADIRPPDIGSADTVVVLDAGGPSEVTLPTIPFEEPIRVVFKIHIEPQADVTRYRTRRDDVEAVRAIAESYGARLTLHGNGEFWQYAAEEGDAPMVRAWIANGHDVGAHMHSVHEEPDGSHQWINATPAQQADDAFVRALYGDHERYLRELVPELVIDQATPYNSLDPGFVDMMADFGHPITGGGRHEIAEGWFGHPPFFPWRLGARYLEEELASPVLIVHHQAQLGEAEDHGPPGGRVFQDHRVEHMQVSFLQIYLNRLYAERSGQLDDRIWLWGFLTHDNQSDAARQTEIDTLLAWLTDTFGHGRVSMRGNKILELVDFRDVHAAYQAWEATHPGVSSNHVETPTPIHPADMTRISEAESRRVYPYAMWGLAQLLRADADHVVDFVAFRAPLGDVEVAELAAGSRADPAQRHPRWLLWREPDGTATVDVRTLVGADDVIRYDAVTGVAERVPASAIVVGDMPVVIERDTTVATRSLGSLVGSDEVELVGDPMPCDPRDTSGHVCGIFRARVGPMLASSGPVDDVTLDDRAMQTHALLVVRAKSEAALASGRWIVLDAGGYGLGYGPSFGGVAPGRYQAGGNGYGDDLIYRYVEDGYVTVDVVWECDGTSGPCAGLPPLVTSWKPAYAAGRAWFHNLDGSGYMGAASRARAVYAWADAQSGAPICAHAQSSGSGRLVAALTRFGVEDLFDTIVFDGGPVWSYVPWVCGTDGGPLGVRPPEFGDGDGASTRDNVDCAFTPGNNEAACSYTKCSGRQLDVVPWVANSSFYRGVHDFPDVDIAVAIGGADTSPAWKHLGLWLAGYTTPGVGGPTIPPLTARSVTLRQGFCASDAGTFSMVAQPCSFWDASRYPGVSGAGVGYDARLATAPHGTAEEQGGMEVLGELMRATCEVTP